MPPGVAKDIHMTQVSAIEELLWGGFLTCSWQGGAAVRGCVLLLIRSSGMEKNESKFQETHSKPHARRSEDEKSLRTGSGYSCTFPDKAS